MSLTVSVVLLAVATTVVPVRARLGDTSFTCSTVVHRQRSDPIASAVCDRVGAYRIRATLGIAALLGVLSILPMVLRRRVELFVWAGASASLALVSVVLLAAVGGRWEHVFFDL